MKVISQKVKDLKCNEDDVYIHREDTWMTPLYTMGDPIVKIGDLRNNLIDNPTSLLISANEDNVPIIRQHLQDVHAELIEHRRWGAPFPLIEIAFPSISVISYSFIELFIV